MSSPLWRARALVVVLALVATLIAAPAPAVAGPGAVVGVAPSPSGLGHWTVTAEGAVRAAGDAALHGSLAGQRLNRPVTGMAATPSGRGYWLVASDGGIFAFGDAGFHGSTGAIRLNQPITGMATTPSGRGYWLVASDGGIFAFGDAGFHGSTGAIRLNQPITGMAATPSGRGYWLVASDGGIFAFGDAGFHGSTGGRQLASPIVGMATTRTGRGYWLAGRDGEVHAFGDAPALHSALAGVVAVGAGPDGGYWLVAGSGAVASSATAAAAPAGGGRLRGDVATAEPGLRSDPSVLWSGTFETTPDWKKTFSIDAANNLQNTTIVNAPGGRTGKSLKVTVAGSADQSQKRGMDFHSGFDSMGIGGQNEAHLRYYVWIPAEHDFVDGGKMPGLAGTRPGTAPTAVGSGGNYSANGWSGRLLFHGDAGLTTYLYVAGVGTKTIDENRNKTNNRIYGFTYRFHQDGDTTKPYLKMKRGAWNHVELYYKMNTPGKSDGVFRGSLNGTLGRTLTDVQYRAAGKGDLDIDQIFMSSFYGGAKGPKTTQTYTFDDVVVSKAPIGPWRP